MIQTNKELYQEINKIIDALRASSDQEYSKKMSEALSISTVTSEVLGESRLVLIELRKTNIAEKLNIKNEIDSSLCYLN